MSRQRSRSRSLAIQAIYQWQMAGQDVGAIISHFLLEQDAKKFDTEYFSELVRAVPTRLTELDEALTPPKLLAAARDAWDRALAEGSAEPGDECGKSPRGIPGTSTPAVQPVNQPIRAHGLPVVRCEQRKDLSDARTTECRRPALQAGDLLSGQSCLLRQ